MIDVAGIDEISVGEMLKVEVLDRTLCLINIAGEIYVLDDRCTHADFSLSQGALDEDAKEIECTKHGALFDIETGKAMCLPATQPVGTYKTKIEDGRILVQVEVQDS